MSASKTIRVTARNFWRRQRLAFSVVCSGKTSRQRKRLLGYTVRKDNT
jgi:hypothetical protein